MSRRRDTSYIEDAFREQYRALDDDTLREIASGDVPWSREGHYPHAARRAARALLVQRGAHDIPHVPRWSPDEALPWGLRSLIVLAAFGLATGAMGTYAAVTSGPPNEGEVCAAARALLLATPFAQRYQLDAQSCEVDDAVRTGRARVAPIRIEACITLDQRAFARLAAESHVAELLEARRFVDRPFPGQHCRESVMAELVRRDHRPWFVRRTPLQ